MKTLAPGETKASMLYPSFCSTRIAAWFRGVRALVWFKWRKFR